MNKEYIEHWINDLISIETISSNTFEQWIDGFKDRYSFKQLAWMNYYWMKRKFKNGLKPYPTEGQ